MERSICRPLFHCGGHFSSKCIHPHTSAMQRLQTFHSLSTNSAGSKSGPHLCEMATISSQQGYRGGEKSALSLVSTRESLTYGKEICGVRMQLTCSHSAKMFLAPLLALSFRRSQLTILKLDSLQGTSGRERERSAPATMSFWISQDWFLSTRLSSANGGLAKRCTRANERYARVSVRTPGGPKLQT